MKNTFLDRYRSKIVLKVVGKNINRFIQKLNRNNIEILSLKNISYKAALLTIYQEDYQKIEDIRTIYDISIIEEQGINKLKKVINYNKVIIISTVLSFILLLVLTNTIFNVQVIHTSSEVRDLILSELKNYNIRKLSFVKSFDYIEDVKSEMLEKYKDKIEWLEIERVGVNYFVRLELRKIPDLSVDYTKQHIVSKKDAIIKKIEAQSGEIVSNINDYVREGEIIISGEVTLNENIKGTVKAIGTVYGEVWYKVKVDYPLVYKEEIITGNEKKVLTVDFLGKRYELFSFNKYKNKKVNDYVIIKDNVMPFSINLSYQKEIKMIENIYTEDEALIEAINLARSKIESKLNDNELIITEKTLNVSQNDSRIEVEVFFSVYEDITDYLKIE